MPDQEGANNKGHLLLRGLDLVTDGMAIISGVLIVIMTLMIVSAVLLRYGFRLSVGWTTELVEYFLYTAVLLGTPWVLKHDQHVKVDVVVNLFKWEKQRWLRITADVLGLMAAIAFCYYGILAVRENFISGTLMVKVMPVPKYVPLTVVPIMSVPLLFQFCRRIWVNVKWHSVDNQNS